VAQQQAHQTAAQQQATTQEEASQEGQSESVAEEPVVPVGQATAPDEIAAQEQVGESVESPEPEKEIREEKELEKQLLKVNYKLLQQAKQQQASC
jgi:hypothetical protein